MNPTHMHERLLTPKQVCEILQISKSKLYRMTQKGLFDVYRIGERGIRYDLNDIEIYLKLKVERGSE